MEAEKDGTALGLRRWLWPRTGWTPGKLLPPTSHKRSVEVNAQHCGSGKAWLERALCLRRTAWPPLAPTARRHSLNMCRRHPRSFCSLMEPVDSAPDGHWAPSAVAAGPNCTGRSGAYRQAVVWRESAIARPRRLNRRPLRCFCIGCFNRRPCKEASAKAGGGRWARGPARTRARRFQHLVKTDSSWRPHLPSPSRHHPCCPIWQQAIPPRKETNPDV